MATVVSPATARGQSTIGNRAVALEGDHQLRYLRDDFCHLAFSVGPILRAGRFFLANETAKSR
jgi:hypothetical protein